MNRSDLELCASLETAELKLVCFEAIIAASKMEAIGNVPEPVPTDTQSVDNVAPAAQSRELQATDMEEPGDSTDYMPTDTQSADALHSTLPARELPATGRETAKTTATPAMQGPDDSFGKEYIERATGSGKRDVILATVMSVQRRHNRKLYFQLANGQLWRQMERGYIQYPRKEAFEVEISQGMMGDYQLRVGGKGRMTRIVRVE